MKNLLLLLISTLFMGTSLFAKEQVIQGIVLDDERQLLAYVNIGIAGTAQGTVSAEDGSFRLYLPKAIAAADTVVFSMVGYESVALTLEHLLAVSQNEPLEIILKSQHLELPEVTVRPQFEHYKTKGNDNADANMFVQFSLSEQPNQNLGAEIGRKFNFSKPVHLERFRFFISANNFEAVKFRVNVRSLQKGKPAAPINKQNIIVEVTDKQSGWITVDLSSYSIEVDDDIVMGIEWIEHSTKGGALNLPITVPSIGAVHYYHYGSQGEWKKFPMVSACMELEVGY